MRPAAGRRAKLAARNNSMPAVPHHAMICRAHGACPPKAQEEKTTKAPKCTSTSLVSKGEPVDADEDFLGWRHPLRRWR